MIRFDIFDWPAPARRQEDNAHLSQTQAGAGAVCRPTGIAQLGFSTDQSEHCRGRCSGRSTFSTLSRVRRLARKL